MPVVASQVWQITRGVCFFGKTISQQAEIRKCPPEDVVDDHDCDIFAVSGHIGLVVRKGALSAHGRSSPLESRFAAF